MKTKVGTLSFEPFPHLVEFLRSQASEGADLLYSIEHICRELGGEPLNLDACVPTGPDNSSAVLRLALICYLDAAFGLLRVENGLATIKELTWCIQADGNFLIATDT